MMNKIIILTGLVLTSIFCIGQNDSLKFKISNYLFSESLSYYQPSNIQDLETVYDFLNFWRIAPIKSTPFESASQYEITFYQISLPIEVLATLSDSELSTSLEFTERIFYVALISQPDLGAHWVYRLSGFTTNDFSEFHSSIKTLSHQDYRSKKQWRIFYKKLVSDDSLSLEVLFVNHTKECRSIK